MRLLTKQWSIKRKLGITSRYAPDSAKPKWMHLRTFHRKLDQIRSLDIALDALDLKKDFEYYQEAQQAGLF
jgi:hypothetical protein